MCGVTRIIPINSFVKHVHLGRTHILLLQFVALNFIIKPKYSLRARDLSAQGPGISLHKPVYITQLNEFFDDVLKREILHV